MDTAQRAARLTSDAIRDITTVAEAWGWTDATAHYGDPDSDLTQEFTQGDYVVLVTWKGTGVHEEILHVEGKKWFKMIFYSEIGVQQELKAATLIVLTTLGLT